MPLPKDCSGVTEVIPLSLMRFGELCDLNRRLAAFEPSFGR
jgi:hypothetical protein